MIIKHLIRKEFLQIMRNSFLPRLIIMYPIMMMCVMPWVTSMEVKNIVVDVVDNDRSTLSQQMVHRIEASNYFIFGGQKATYEEALRDVERSQADIIVEIPPHYARDYESGKQPQLLIVANAVNGMKGSMGAAYMTQIVTPATASKGIAEALYLYNKNLDYKIFMIPGLMAILIMLLCGMLPALNIVGEKEAGTIETINVTPVSKSAFILAKLIPYWIIGMVVISICFVLSWLVYGITPVGSIGLIYLISMLLALIFSGIGLIVSNYNESMQQSVLVIWFIVMSLMLLSGIFTPARSMPKWAFVTTYINPMTYYVDAIRTIFVRGGTFASITPQVIGLTIIAIIMDTWAIISYKKNS